MWKNESVNSDEYTVKISRRCKKGKLQQIFKSVERCIK